MEGVGGEGRVGRQESMGRRRRTCTTAFAVLTVLLVCILLYTNLAPRSSSASQPDPTPPDPTPPPPPPPPTPLPVSFDTCSVGDVVHRRCCADGAAAEGGFLDQSTPARPVWHGADGCVVPPFHEQAAAACFANKSFVVLGDSLTRAIFLYEPNRIANMTDCGLYAKRMAKKGLRAAKKGQRWKGAGAPCSNLKFMRRYSSAYRRIAATHNDVRSPAGIHWFWAPSLNLRNHAVHPAGLGAETPVGGAVGDALQHADVVVVNGGMSDMGQTYCGPEEFYRGARAVLRTAKLKARPGAAFIALGLHQLKMERCAANPVCKQCNHPRKEDVFREAFKLAAACEAFPYVTTLAPTTAAGLNATSDGVHYGGPLSKVEMDFVLGSVCRVPAMQATAATECTAEAEEAALARWRAVEEAGVGCASLTQEESCGKGPRAGKEIVIPEET